MKAEIFDQRVCTLGEGAFWHPLRQQFYWFDILGKKLLSTDGWECEFDTYASAMGWIDQEWVLVATATDLTKLSLDTGESQFIAALESDQPVTRSNDGRADPQGGFWIGTMGLNADKEAGAIYRFYKGEIRKLYPDISIPNAICFSTDGSTAYFTDTPTKIIQQVALDANGWPASDPKPFLDLSDTDLNPDGAVIDAEGCLWNAQWGAARVARYSPQGDLLQTVEVDGLHASCPAFGGADLDQLLITTAQQGRKPADPGDGQTYLAQLRGLKGQTEHRVLLG